jgi:threonine aldolase
VVVFNTKLAEHIYYKQKQVMQLASKTRFIAAQYEALFTGELWKKPAGHANAMAQKLNKTLSQFSRITITRPVEANVVFAVIPPSWTIKLQEVFPFYVWNEATHEVRLMCSWDTREEDIGQLETLIQSLENS